MKRLTVLAMLLGLAATASATPGGSPVQQWRFTALLDGKEIGYHRFLLTDDGNRREILSEAQFDVKFLFFNAYRYVHASSERWRGNCLQSISAHTDDNGKPFAVRGAAGDGQFVLSGARQPETLPACVMTFAYWNPAMLNQTHLLNAQNGDYLNVDVVPLGRESIRVRGTSVPAQRYALRAKGIAIDLWYSLTNDWLALESVTADGHHLRYEIR
jgi:hypothetical protein